MEPTMAGSVQHLRELQDWWNSFLITQGLWAAGEVADAEPHIFRVTLRVEDTSKQFPNSFQALPKPGSIPRPQLCVAPKKRQKQLLPRQLVLKSLFGLKPGRNLR